MVKMSAVRDQFNRPLHDLRVSLTDRCNFRCPYCMPAEVFGPGHAFLRDAQLMTPGELARLARAFVALGVEKIRLTGGEPLLRPDVPEIVRALKREVGVPEVALTTNGWFLESFAPALREAGLDRLNISVDSLDDANFAQLNGRGLGRERVLRGIDAAVAAGLPVKINCVVQRGVNDGGMLDLCAYFRERRLTLRFSEFMDVGRTNGWRPELVVPAREIVEKNLRDVAARAARAGLSRRGGPALPLCRRRRRARDYQLGDGAVLPRLPPRASFG